MKHVTLMIATLLSAFRQLDCRRPFFDPRLERSDAIDNDAAFAAAPSAAIASPYVSKHQSRASRGPLTAKREMALVAQSYRSRMSALWSFLGARADIIPSTVEHTQFMSKRLDAAPRVCRVPRVHRVSVEPDVWHIAAIFLKFLRTVMTLFAQALKRTQPELVHVTSVWRDVIADAGWRIDAAFQAEGAQRRMQKLKFTDTPPFRT